jgi:hypothetical protein
MRGGSTLQIIKELEIYFQLSTPPHGLRTLGNLFKNMTPLFILSLQRRKKFLEKNYGIKCLYDGWSLYCSTKSK